MLFKKCIFVLATQYFFSQEVHATNVDQLQEFLVLSHRFASLVKSAGKRTPILGCELQSSKRHQWLKFSQGKEAKQATFEQLVLQQFLSKGKLMKVKRL